MTNWTWPNNSDRSAILRRAPLPLWFAVFVACGGDAREGAPLPPAGESASALSIGGRCTSPSLATGGNHTCIVKPGGLVACWGANSAQQLGSALPVSRATPAEVAGVAGAVQVSAGSSHTCTVLADSTVECWGSNTSGQLGLGRVSRVEAPAVVPGLTGITSLSAGSVHTCALRNDGTVWCWGSNGSGRLGDGTTTRRASPVQVQGLSGAVAVSAGDASTCALTGAGLAYCWGANTSGQLGDGTQRSHLRPVLVTGGHRWRSLAVGRDFACGVLQEADNGVLCWGRNALGQLGDGTLVAYRTAPAAVLVAATPGGPTTGPLGDGVVVSAGGSSACAILGDGRAVCWGSDNNGQLGDGANVTARRSASPVSAAAPLDGAFLLVSNGSAHTCALALDGELFCWGANGSGQLGDTTHTRRSRPVRVGAESGLTFAAFGAVDSLPASLGAATSVIAAGDDLFAAGVEIAGPGRGAWIVRRSTDGGASWRTVDRLEVDVAGSPHVRLARLPSGTLLAAGSTSDEDGNSAWLVRRSADGGATWETADTTVFDRSGRPAVVHGMTADSTGHVIVVGSYEDASGSHWLVRASSDAGSTWFVADDFTTAGRAEGRAVITTAEGAVIAAGLVTNEAGETSLRIRRAATLGAGATWSELQDVGLDGALGDTEAIALDRDVGGRIYVVAPGGAMSGLVRVLASRDGGLTWASTGNFALEGYTALHPSGLLVDRAGTLHVVGDGTETSGADRGLVASSYDHGATWRVADTLASAFFLGAAESPSGAILVAGLTGPVPQWTVRERACHNLAPSCGNWVIDPGELCDGACSDCNDHDACTHDVMTGSPATCDVVCANAPIVECASNDGCCPAGCTSDLDLDCCTGAIVNGACQDVSFEITDLTEDECTTLEHAPVTGTSRGGLALSTSNVFVTGNGSTNRGTTGRFSASDLGGGRATTYDWEQIFSDLKTGTVYVLGAGGVPLFARGGTATTLIPLNPATGQATTPRITLSSSVRVSAARSFFSGYGRLLFHNGAHLYDILLPSGRVTDLGSMALPEHHTCPNGGTWGTAESIGDQLFIDYVAGDEVRRTRVPDGRTTVLHAFTDLGDTCAFVAAPATRRWYFDYSGAAQFASGSATLGFCDASFRRPNAPSVCGDGMLEGPETCEGDCPAACSDGDACTRDLGSPSTCDCRHEAVTACASGDGCCPTGCNANTDSDCQAVCGNGLIEPGETCDGDCPTSCPSDGDVCTTDAFVGSAASCDAACTHPAITACTSGDGCCPAGCTALDDHDCAPVPVLTALDPSHANVGGPSMVLTLEGTGFIAGAQALYDGDRVAVTRVSDTELHLPLAAAALATAGTHAVSVTTVGGTTDALTFTVQYPSPTITTLTPSSAFVDAAAFTLTIDGTDFVGGAVVRLAQTVLASSYVSATRLTATIPASALTSTGQWNITVTNPAPTAGASVPALFTVTTQPPSAPAVTPPTAFSNTTASPLVSWAAATPVGSATIVRYEVSVGASAGDTSLYGWAANGLTLSRQVTGLSMSDGQVRYFNVRAVDSAGAVSAVSSVPFTVDGAGPSAPTNVARGTTPWVTTQSPAVTYTAATDAGSGVGRYEAMVARVSDGAEVQGWTAHASGSALTGLNLAAQTQYVLYVRAIDAVGNTGAVSYGVTWTTPYYYGYTGSPQTFTVPDGVTSVRVAATGAGGAGGHYQYEGGGGGGGGFGIGDYGVSPGETYTITIGRGGQVTGESGGDTSFGTLLIARGGGGANVDYYYPSLGGGATGANVLAYSGGAGGYGNYVGGLTGGGGGSAGGLSGPGRDGVGAYPYPGGNGAAGSAGTPAGGLGGNGSNGGNGTDGVWPESGSGGGGGGPWPFPGSGGDGALGAGGGGDSGGGAHGGRGGNGYLAVVLEQTRVFAYTGSAQTFTVPANVFSIRVMAMGAGGSGAHDGAAGGGGGGGGFGVGDYSVTPGDTFTVFVGRGGVPSGQTGQAGGATSFGSFLTANGGGTGNGTAAGSGGSVTGANVLSYSGGNGGAGCSSAGNSGGGGGSAAGISGAGRVGGNCTVGVGAAGSAGTPAGGIRGVNTTGGVGSNGVWPDSGSGGGGGGIWPTASSGGAGGRGAGGGGDSGGGASGGRGGDGYLSVSWQPTYNSCPPNYVRVPASGTYGTSEFCVAKYEMKSSSGAKSLPAGTPWVSIPRGADASTYGAARKACRDLGSDYDLISNSQWQVIARSIESVGSNWSAGTVGSGLLNRGHSDASPAALLAASADSDPYYGTGNTSGDQKRTHTLSNGEIIWDFAGNAAEWVAEDRATLNWQGTGISGLTTVGLSDIGSTNPNAGIFGAAGGYTAGAGIGLINGGSGGAVYRGGAFGDGDASGVFAAALDLGSDVSSANVGFRCVYQRRRVDCVNGSPSPGDVCTQGGAIYLGILGGQRYMTTPGGCGDIPAASVSGGTGADRTYALSDFIPTCVAGVDSVTKTWIDYESARLNRYYDVPEIVNYSTGGNVDANSGSANTAAMAGITDSYSGGYHAAARYCDKLSYGGYTDWFLPNRPELNLIYANRWRIQGVNTSGARYWSSTEQQADRAWFQTLGDGAQSTISKYNGGVIRCMRRW